MSYTSYTSVEDASLEQTGARRASGVASGASLTQWRGLWGEVFRSQAFKDFPHSTATVVICFVVEALPIAQTKLESSTANLLAAVEKIFGDSVSNMAKILRVSRPMIYHYRAGMEPSVENLRRLRALAALASECETLVSHPLKSLLKRRQPEGKTLLEFLSDEDLDMGALRRLLRRNIDAADQALRNNLAAALSRRETVEERGDIVRDRHAAGKPVYVGDPEAPGKLIQILPGGRRVHGRMVRRQFVPDEK